MFDSKTWSNKCTFVANLVHFHKYFECDAEGLCKAVEFQSSIRLSCSQANRRSHYPIFQSNQLTRLKGFLCDWFKDWTKLISFSLSINIAFDRKQSVHQKSHSHSIFHVSIINTFKYIKIAFSVQFEKYCFMNQFSFSLDLCPGHISPESKISIEFQRITKVNRI